MSFWLLSCRWRCLASSVSRGAVYTSSEDQWTCPAAFMVVVTVLVTCGHYEEKINVKSFFLCWTEKTSASEINNDRVFMFSFSFNNSSLRSSEISHQQMVHCVFISWQGRSNSAKVCVWNIIFSIRSHFKINSCRNLKGSSTLMKWMQNHCYDHKFTK